MIESIFLKTVLSAKGEQYSLTLVFTISIGWCIMKIKSILKSQNSMSIALTRKTDKEMCEQKHGEIDVHMNDLKKGNAAIVKKVDDLITVLLTGNIKQ